MAAEQCSPAQHRETVAQETEITDCLLNKYSLCYIKKYLFDPWLNSLSREPIEKKICS